MKKTISMMLAVVLCMGLFTGCGDKSPKPPKEVTEIVEAVNKSRVEEDKTTKENFNQIETVNLDNGVCYSYESNAIDKKSGKDYVTTIKFVCKENIVEEIEISTTIAYGSNMYGVNNYMKTRDDFKMDEETRTRITYKKRSK